MQTYSEQSARLTLDSSVAVMVLMGAAPDDAEFLPLRPRIADEAMLTELKVRWPGRGLRPVGIIGLVGTTPKVVLKEPLEPEQITRLASAFLAYLHVLFHDSFAEQMAAAEITELERVYSLPDTRLSN